jgi:ubiquinone/menaquinone biosynthesis C-methylase UbiE
MPPTNPSTIASIYNERSTAYDTATFYHRLAEEYIRAAAPQPGARVLDLACGTGLVAFRAEAQVGPTGYVVGVDISEGMLEVAREKAQRTGSRISFYQHDISDLTGLNLNPHPGGESDGTGQFDLITCAAALVLLPDPLGAIRHWASLLREGGRLVTDVAARDVHVPARIFERIGPELGLSLQWDQSWVKGEESLAELLREAGLEVERVYLSPVLQVKEHKVEQAGDLFEQAVSGPMFRNFGVGRVRDEAKRLFVQRFVGEAGEGVLVDEAKMYIGVAVKR